MTATLEYSRSDRAWNRRLDQIRACDERNLAWREMDLERREWGDKLDYARRHGLPRPIGGGLIKARYEISRGLRGIESGWDIDTVPVADFGNVNLAAAGTIRTLCDTFPNFNPVHSTGYMDSQDLMPFEQPAGTLGAASGARVAGSSVNPLAVLVGVYLVRITAAAAVYLPVTTTINVRAVSTVTTVGGAFSTVATFNASAGVNFVESIPIAAPVERQLAALAGAVGTLLSTVSGVFNGDSHFVELVAAGALNVQGNILSVELEVI